MSMSSVVATFEANIAPLQAALTQATTSINATALAMRAAGDNMGNAFTKAGTTATKSSSNMREALMGIGVAAAGVGTAIAAGLGVAVKTFADFEQQITNAGVIAGASKKELDQLKETAIQLGASTSKSSSEVAAAMTEMARSGFKVNEIIAAMPGVISASVASNEDLARTSEVVTAALNGFQLKASDASHVADVMAQTANMSAAGINDLGYAFEYASPLAKNLGVSLEQLSAAVGILSNAGIKGTAAGTALRSILNDLSNPTKKAIKEMEQLGVSVFDSHGKFVGLSEMVRRFTQATQGMTDAQKMAALGSIFESDSLNAMMILMQQGKGKIDEFSNALVNSGGASQRAAAQMQQTFSGAMEQLSGAFESLGITIGQALAPFILKVAQVIQTLIQAFLSLPGPVQQFLAVGAAVLSVLLILGGLVAIVVGGLTMLATTFGVTVGVVAAWIGGILGGVAAIFALGAALVYAYNQVSWFRDMVNQAWQMLTAGFQAVVAYLQPAVQAVVTFIVQQWQKIVTWWQTNGQAIIQVVQTVWNFITQVISIAMQTLIPIIQAAWNVIVTIIKTAWEIVKTVVSAALTVILNLISLFANLLTGNWRGAWENLKVIVSTVLSAIWSLVKSVFLGINSTVLSALNLIRTTFSSVWNGIKALVSTILNAILNNLKSIFSSAVSFISNVMNSLRNAISNGFNAAVNTIKNAGNTIKSVLSGLASQAFSWGRNLISMFASGIESAAGAVIAKARSIANTVKQYLGFSSPTEKGPASNSDKWAPNFVNMFASGLAKGTPKIAGAASALADSMSMLNQPYAVSFSTSGAYVGASTMTSETQNGQVVVTGNTFIVRKESDIQAIATELNRQKTVQLRGKGMVR